MRPTSIRRVSHQPDLSRGRVKRDPGGRVSFEFTLVQSAVSRSHITPDSVEKLLSVERLAELRVRVWKLACRRDREDGNRRELRITLLRMPEVPAIHADHHQIEHDEF